MQWLRNEVHLLRIFVVAVRFVASVHLILGGLVVARGIHRCVVLFRIVGLSSEEEEGGRHEHQHHSPWHNIFLLLGGGQSHVFSPFQLHLSLSPPTFQYRHCRNHRPQIPLPHSNPNAHRPLHPLLRTILPPSQIRHHQLTHQKIKIDPLLLLQKVRRCLQSRQGIGSQHQSRRSQGTNAR